MNNHEEKDNHAEKKQRKEANGSVSFQLTDPVFSTRKYLKFFIFIVFFLHSNKNFALCRLAVFPTSAFTFRDGFAMAYLTLVSCFGGFFSL